MHHDDNLKMLELTPLPPPPSESSDSDSETDEMLHLHSPYLNHRKGSKEEIEDTDTDDSDTLPLTPSNLTGTPYPKTLENYFYPPNLPHSVQLFRKSNIAIPLCYFLVGALQGLSGPLMNVYPLFLNATEAQQITISGLRSLPASFKLFFGFASDSYTICGYRRKSYMVIGWLLASLSMFTLLFFMLTSVDNKPAVSTVSLLYFLFGLGFWYADVMADSVVAEKSRFEPVFAKGKLQATCYGLRFLALMIFAPISTVLFDKYGAECVVLIMAILPILILPFVYYLNEEKGFICDGPWKQIQEIWATVCSRGVWQPMGFVYLYNVLQIGNSAWKQYLQTTLNFTYTQLNMLLIVSYVLLYVGVIVYKNFLLNTSWRTVYISTTCVNLILSIFQVLLIKNITLGLSPFVFALGDDALAEFIGGVQFLPTTIMMVNLCPKGSEGASYAMFTTVNNAALNLSGMIGSGLLGIWDVSKEALSNNDLSGMLKLTLLTTALQFSGILFVGLLPETRDDLMKLNYEKKSKIGGGIFLTITFVSLSYTVFAATMNVVYPGWMGES